MTVTHKINAMDLTVRGVTPRISVKQGDKNSRAVEIPLLEAGKAWTIPAGVTAIVRYRKRDGTAGLYDTMPDGTTTAVTYTGNVLTVNIAPQMLTCPGLTRCDVVLIHGAEVLATFDFHLAVEPSPVDNDTLESQDYYKVASLAQINEALEALKAYVDQNRVVVDETLTEQGQAADAFSVGDKFREVIQSIGEKVSKSGGTMTGPLDMGGNSITGADSVNAATLAVIPVGSDPDAGGYLAAGESELGDDGLPVRIMELYGNAGDEPVVLRHLGTPRKDSDAANKAYVDAAAGSGSAGADGGYYTPAVDGSGNLTWVASKSDMPAVAGANIKGPHGETGAAGRGITSIARTSGTGAAGTKDTYTITFTDNTKTTFQVYNGADGKSAYQYAQDGGYTGTEAEFVAKMAEEIPAVDATLTQGGQAADAKATGDAIRALSEEKAGKNDLPTALPNPNAITINGVSYDGSAPVDVTIRGDADAVPDYVRTEAETVAANVQSTRKAGSFVLPIFTDFHIWADDAKTDESYVNTRSSVVLAGQALSELRQRIGFDAAAMLGDYTWGGKPYTAEQIMADITYVKRTFADGLKGVTTAWLTGNHDINYPANRDRIVTADEQYAYIAANGPELVRDPDNLAGNYGYLDFPNQRIRLVCLNTTDVMEEFPEVDGAAHTSENISEKQGRWFATKALDFSDKSDASAWGIVILSHHPISIFLNRGFILKLLEAYKNGESGSVTANFTPYSGYPAVNYTIDYDYTSGDKAQILCNIHGHVHNCGYGYMSSADDVTPWMLRLCIPQVCYTRNNEAATSTDTNYAQKYGEFDSDGNPVYYQKTAGTAQGTSFCVVDINKADRMVHAYIYGAGIDRSLGIDPASYTVTFVTNGGNTVASQTVSSGGKATAPTTPTKDGYTFVGWYSDSGLENAYDFNTVVTGDITLYAKWEEVQIVSYSVTNNLTNVVTSNIISTVNEGESYSATLSANSGYELNSVAVSMGGIDITSTTYSNGLVSISSVTGDIVITASAELIATYTNRIRTAVSDAGGTVYGTNGYIVDTYASSSGLATGAASGYVSTGAMPVPDPNATTLTVYIKGGTFDGTSQCRLYPYDSRLTRQGGITKITDGTSSGFVTLVTKLADEYYKVDLKWNYHGAGVYHYFRFSIKCNAEDAPNLICTFNEPIE